MKKILSFVLALCMICTLLPATALTAFAAETSETISFASTAQRVSQTTTKQVWSNGGITFTNNKGSSTSNVANYSNPVRLYANSELVFEAPEGSTITKIEVTANSSNYATVLKNSAGNEASVSGSKVTITPTASSNSYKVAKLTAQTRFNSLTIYYEVAASAYTIDATSNNTDYGTVELVGNRITATPAAGYEISGYTVLSGTATVTRDDDVFTVEASSDCEIQINFAKRTEKTATFYVNGAEYDSITDYTGETITVPEYDGTVVEGYNFVGWVTDEVEETTDTQKFTAAGENYVLSDNVTFYALFARTEEGGTASGNAYQKFTGELTTGDYILTYNNMAMNTDTTTKNNKLYRTPVTPNGDVISNPAANIVWTITVADDYVTIYSASAKKYVKASGNSSTNISLNSTGTTNNEKWNIPTANNGTYDFVSKVGGTRALRYHPTNDAWGYYATSNGGPLTLYKLANVTTYYTTSPVTAKPVVQYTYTDSQSTFATWEEALEAAEQYDNIGVLTLLADLKIDEIDLEGTDLVLDLNGKTLTVNTITANVMDTAPEGVQGLIKADTAKLSGIDGYMILWDDAENAGGYRAFHYTMESMVTDNEATEEEGDVMVKTFWNVLQFENSYAYTVLASRKSGLNRVAFELGWNGVTKPYDLEDSVILDWAADEETETTKDFGFYIRVTGFENLETSGTVTVKSIVQSAYDAAEKNNIETFDYVKS